MMLFQTILVICLSSEMADKFTGYSMPPETEFRLFLSKFVITIAVHLNISPVIQQGLDIIRYVNNHPEKFDQPWICYFLGLTILSFSFLFEYLNILNLYSKSSVYYTLGSYFSMSIIVYLQKMYYNTKIASDHTMKLKDVFNDENLPKITWKSSKEGSWASRSFFNKVGRFIFKLIKGFYVSYIFYFLPFTFLLVQLATN